MEDREKSVVRFSDGKVLKGYLRDFSPQATDAIFEEETGDIHTIRIDDLKAVFFVKSFEGNHAYKDKKIYGISHNRGHRVFIKFKDGESLVGFLDGSVPWEKGFFLSKRDNATKGFFLYPADSNVNNIRIFVVAASVSDVTIVP
ncbi:MAG: hypothetical protein M0Z79_07160 [Nitrospiraceae bacterium]|nr:hypothetical protein [Nitrospiraceae bacterium]